MKRSLLSVHFLTVATLLTSALLARESVLPAAATAATYYVAKTGSDTTSCPSAQALATPKLTIKSGLSCLKAGDTLSVRAGTYAEPLDSNALKLPVGTSWANAPRIAAYSGEKVTLTRGSSARVWNFQNPYVQYLIFDGFVLDATGAENGIKIQAGAHHVRIQNCEVKNAAGQGILMTGGTLTHHNEVLRCNIHANGKDAHFDHGMYIAASDNLIEDCEVHHNLAYGVHVYDGSTHAAHRNIVRRVKAHHNGENGILLGSGTGNLAYNNLVYANGKAGIQVGFGGAAGTKVYNNTVYQNGAEGLQIRSTAANTLVKNNIVYLNSMPINNQGVNTTLANNLLTDPRFVNAAGADFRLTSSSAAVDKGLVLSEVADDYERTPRPAGTSSDIGADEYTPASVSPPPAAPTGFQIVLQ